MSGLVLIGVSNMVWAGVIMAASGTHFWPYVAMVNVGIGGMCLGFAVDDWWERR
jgi:hypothetical protein